MTVVEASDSRSGARAAQLATAIAILCFALTLRLPAFGNPIAELDEQTILYHLTRACLPGRYVFPGHFTDPGESNALERPSSDILRATLASRPGAIVATLPLRESGVATANDRIIADALMQGYRVAGRRAIRLYGIRRVTAVVWVRR